MSTFVGFVLLDENKFDKKQFITDFKNDWAINIKVEDNENTDENILIGEIENKIIAVSLMPAPIPNEEAVQNAKTNFRWNEAISVAEKHKAHLIVSLMNKNDKEILDDSDIYQKLLATAANQKNCTGINILGTVLHPKAYREFAQYYHENSMFPIENLIFFGLYSNDNSTISAYTYGLDFYGKKELEIIDSSGNPEEVYYFLVNIADYVITSDVILKDGETIGMSEEQKIAIIESAGVALDGTTLKIAY